MNMLLNHAFVYRRTNFIANDIQIKVAFNSN